MINLKKYLKLPQNSKTRVLMIAVIIILVLAIIASVIYRHDQNQFMGDDTQLRGISGHVNSNGNSSSQLYLKTLLQSDQIQATNALKQGASSIPSILPSDDSQAQTNSFVATDASKTCMPAQESSTDSLLDQLVKSGQISPDVAADLQRLENSGASTQSYAAELQKLVAEGKLTPAQAAALLAAYKKQHGDVTTNPDALTDQLLASGAITPATAQALKALNAENLTPEQYAAKLQELVREGKLTPAQAAQLMAAYNASHGVTGNAENNPDALADQLLASGVITPATAQALKALNAENLTPEQYAAKLQELVREGKLTPAQAAKLLAAYRKQHEDDVTGISDATSPASQLQQLQQMQASQQAIAEQNALNIANQAAEQQRQMQQAQQLQSMQSAMAAQANTLYTAWNAPTPAVATIISATDKSSGGSASSSGSTSSGSGAAAHPMSRPLIKAGTVMFAILDTAVNSDYPAPIMATIVAGKYNGAKLIGNVVNQNDRVMLQFNMMTMPNWASTVGVSSVAIDPDTSRTAIASEVNHHYISRYSGVFASSFIAGMSDAISQNGSTLIFNPTTGAVQGYTQANYSPMGRTFVALGEVGKKLSGAAQENFNRPPTVKVDRGVGLAIFFQTDVAKPDFLKDESSN